MKKWSVFFFCLLLSWGVYAWNAIGHQLVAQIAWDQLTPEAKQMVNAYNRAFSKNKHFSNVIVAATWLDTLRAKDVHWYDHLHYIDWPFSVDGSVLVPVQENNALWAIQQAVSVLSSKYSSQKDKGLSLRILIHVVGDIHQPLHSATQVSKEHPKGDLGGNLFPLAKNNIGSNLHKYWDNGGGILLGQSQKNQIKNKAMQLEKKWACSIPNRTKSPKQWVKESNQLAQAAAYSISPGTKPDKKYQFNTQHLVEKQILFAGCRLGQILNQLAGA